MLNALGTRKMAIIRKLVRFHIRQVRTSLLRKLNLRKVNHMQLNLGMSITNNSDNSTLKIQSYAPQEIQTLAMASWSRLAKKTHTPFSGSRTVVKKLSIRRPTRSVGLLGPITRLSATRNAICPTTKPSSSQTRKKTN